MVNNLTVFEYKLYYITDGPIPIGGLLEGMKLLLQITSPSFDACMYTKLGLKFSFFQATTYATNLPQYARHYIQNLSQEILSKQIQKKRLKGECFKFQTRSL